MLLRKIVKMKIPKNKIVAHRGAWKDFGFSENSLDAFLKAQALGLGGVELDVHLTKDNQLVVFHDDCLNDQLIENLTADEIKSNANTSIFMLEELLEKWNQNIKLFIDVKTANSNLNRRLVLVDRLIPFIEKCPDYVCVISFELATLRIMKEQYPFVQTMYLGSEISLEFLKEKGIDGIDFSTSTFLANKDLIPKAKELSLQTNAWVVNDLDIAHQLLNLDYLTTDEILSFINLE